MALGPVAGGDQDPLSDWGTAICRGVSAHSHIWTSDIRSSVVASTTVLPYQSQQNGRNGKNEGHTRIRDGSRHGVGWLG